MLLFVGYQGQGTLGAHLQAGAKQVILDGAARTVRCEVRSISGFSAHADESELIDWLRHLAAAAASRGACSWSTAIRMARWRSCPKVGRSGSNRTGPPGARRSSSTDGPRSDRSAPSWHDPILASGADAHRTSGTDAHDLGPLSL